MKQPADNKTPANLAEWLNWLEQLHPQEIELGLDRIQQVARSLDVLQPADRVITVAGTNGKGSCVAMLSRALQRAGLRVASYTSPHLLQYNERICLDGQPASDSVLCEAFAAVDAARGDVSLTYFEFGTLAALWLIKRAQPDIAILEVGLGGRLDAVNLVDADIALVTNIGLDHQDWLGTDREAIGREKAGIFRPGGIAVYNDPQPVESVMTTARGLGCRLYRLGGDYEYAMENSHWRWQHSGFSLRLPLPEGLPPHQIENAAGVLMCLYSLAGSMDLDMKIAARELARTLPAGRSDWRLCENAHGRFRVLLDVAHNTEAVKTLAQQLQSTPCAGRTIAVYAALADKPVEAIGHLMAPRVDEWLVAGLSGARAADADAVATRLATAGVEARRFATPVLAWQAATQQAGPQDRIVVFGSFYTVQAVIESIEHFAYK